MQRLSDEIGRKMIPRWRTLRLTPNQELISSKRTKFVRHAGDAAEFTQLEWISDPTPWSALDMVSMGLVNGKSRATDSAAYFLRERLADLQGGARQLVLAYFDDLGTTPLPVAVHVTREIRYRQIAELKLEILSYPRNPILHVEIARAYVALGQMDRAEHSFNIALGLSPSNRYVVRSAVRFFVLTQQADRAWSILRDVPKDDPWLTASKISIADLIEKPIDSGRRLREMIDAGDPAQMTELAAAVATLELHSGSDKLAKKLFRKGCEVPTDNTIAQVRWAHETAGIPFNKALLRNELTFEARTGQALEESEWGSALASASRWLGDEPFSSRAAATGAFISAELLQDFEQCSSIATAGLMVNQHDATLLNNRAYALAVMNRTLEAREDLHLAMSSKDLETTDAICLSATMGCVLYREGSPEEGAEFYRKAYEQAVETKNVILSKRALIHWIAEEGRIGRLLDPQTAQKIQAHLSNPKTTDRETRAIYAVNASDYLNNASVGNVALSLKIAAENLST